MLVNKYESITAAISAAQALEGSFVDSITFHCYWNGDVSEKQLISVRSCYFYNVLNTSNRIVFWHENTQMNEWFEQISQYAEVRMFDANREVEGTIFETFDSTNHFTFFDKLKSRLSGRSLQYRALTFLSDKIRCLLLLKYGGFWFDLDVLFLRSVAPVLAHVKDMPFVYEWPGQNHPNNAIFGNVSSSGVFEDIVKKIYYRDRGWGFQQAKLTYDLPLDLLVLPCAWFDPGWVDLEPNVGFNFFSPSDQKYDFENFYKGAFSYHWHNQWNAKIESSSIARQLDDILKANIIGSRV